MQRVRAEVRRQDLVAATVAVIAEHGVKGATTRRIAEAAGCPLASLHYVFHSKDELLLAVYESLIDLIRSDSPDAPEHGSLADLAEFNLRSVMAWFEANPAYAKTQSELYTWALRHQPDVAVGALRISLEGARAYLSSAEPRPDAKALDAVARLTIALADGLLFPGSLRKTRNAWRPMSITRARCWPPMRQRFRMLGPPRRPLARRRASSKLLPRRQRIRFPTTSLPRRSHHLLGASTRRAAHDADSFIPCAAAPAREPCSRAP